MKWWNIFKSDFEKLNHDRKLGVILTLPYCLIRHYIEYFRGKNLKL